MDLGNVNKQTKTRPDSWLLTSLESISKIIYRYPSFYGLEHLSQGIPVIRGEHIKRNGSISPDWSEYWFVSEDTSKKFPKTIMDLGDLVVTVRGTIGKFGYIDENLIGAQLSPNCLKISLFKEHVTPKFIYLLFHSIFGKRLIIGNISATTINTIKASDLKKIKLLIPPLHEQKEIVRRIEDLFAKLDAGVEELGKVKKQLKRYRLAVLKAAFTGDLTKEWREKVMNDELRVLNEEQKELEKYKIDDPELPELPEGWIWIKIGACADIIMGQSPPGTSYNTEGKGTPLINGPVEFGPTPFSKTIKSKFTNKPKKMCKENDLILCVRGSTTGRMNIAGFDACIGRGVAAIKSRFSQKYLNNFIHYKEKDILKIGTGSTFPNISSKQISEIDIPLPSTKEQNKIVEEIEKRFKVADEVGKVVGESLKKAKQLRQSILREAFNGNLTKKWREEHPELITGENSAQALLDKIKKEREKNI